MRTSIDFPDPIMKRLKHISLERDISLRALLLDLIEKGLASEQATASDSKNKADSRELPPFVRGKSAMKLTPKQLSNSALFDLLDKK